LASHSTAAEIQPDRRTKKAFGNQPSFHLRWALTFALLQPQHLAVGILKQESASEPQPPIFKVNRPGADEAGCSTKIGHTDSRLPVNEVVRAGVGWSWAPGAGGVIFSKDLVQYLTVRAPIVSHREDGQTSFVRTRAEIPSFAAITEDK